MKCLNDSHILHIKKQVLQAAKEAYGLGLMAGTSGNISVRIPHTQTMLVTPTSIDYGAMTLEDLVTMEYDGTVLEGGVPTSEWQMHAEVYRTMGAVGAQVHTHSPYATGFAVCRAGIPFVLIEMKPFLGGDIRVAGFAPAGTREVGVEAVAALAGRNACLLANHGTLCTGLTLASALKAAIYLEDAAKIYHLALLSGSPVILPAEQ